MTSYQTVQVVAFSATPIANQDYIVLSPGYTVSNGSVAPAGGGASSSTSLTLTSVFSSQVGASNVTLDLPAVVAAGSFLSVTVDKYGRVTTGATSVSTAAITGTWTSAVSSANVVASTVSAGQVFVSGLTYTWPSVYSGPFGVLVDTDGNGLLTWVNASGSTETSVAVTSRLSATVTHTAFEDAVLLDLPTTGVAAASSYNSLTVDVYGRVTNAQTVVSGNSLKWTSALSVQVTGSLVTLDLPATGVTPASSYNSVTVDVYGRVTAAQVVAGGGSGSGYPLQLGYAGY